MLLFKGFHNLHEKNNQILVCHILIHEMITDKVWHAQWIVLCLLFTVFCKYSISFYLPLTGRRSCIGIWMCIFVHFFAICFEIKQEQKINIWNMLKEWNKIYLKHCHQLLFFIFFYRKHSYSSMLNKGMLLWKYKKIWRCFFLLHGNEKFIEECFIFWDWRGCSSSLTAPARGDLGAGWMPHAQLWCLYPLVNSYNCFTSCIVL